MTGVGIAMQETVLGQAIAKARRQAGLTQQQLCSKANLSYSTLAKIERGAIKTPSVFTVAAIAEATGTTVELLAGLETAKASEAPQKAYKTSKTGIKFVYFDVNGVLVRYYQRAFTNIAADYNVSSEKVESIFWQYNDRLNRGKMPVNKFDTILANAANTSSISWAEYYLANVDPVIEMNHTVKWVAENYRLGLLTNNLPGLTKAMINRKILPSIDYNSVVDSSEVGFVKPESEIFNKACQMAGVKPEEILLVDDERANVMAAEHMGWHVLWFDDYNSEASEQKIRQVLEF